MEEKLVKTGVTPENVSKGRWYVEIYHVTVPTKEYWYWHARSANGEIMARGEEHTREHDTLRAATRVVGSGVEVRYYEVTG